MTITYNIQNVTPDLVHTVMLRKFFQMVFMGNDRRSLRIYTATVIGASNTINNNLPDKGSSDYISNLTEIEDFRIKFDFLIGNSDNNEIESIWHEDITESENGFLNEISCIRKVWGNDCDIIFDDQSMVLSKLKGLGNAPDNDESLKKASAELSKYKLLWTKQEKNGKVQTNLSSLSIHGAFQIAADRVEPNPRDDVARKSAYTIGIPKGINLPKGIELVNWVRTTIRYKDEIDDNNLNYTIKKSIQLDNPTTYWAPDFTWYFSPVVKSYIDNQNSIVEVKRQQSSSEYECTCPIQKKKVFASNDKFQNSIDSVPNKMTVDFSFWTQEKIRLRQKYRLAAKEILPSESTFDSLSEINIFLDTADEHSRGNRQFITSILISFALAFGIDSSRLNQVADYFIPCLPADVLWLVILIIFSLTLINTPVAQSDPTKEKGIIGWLSKYTRKIRKCALSISIIWVILVFVVLRIPQLSGVIHDYSYFLRIGMWLIYGLACLVNGVYLFLWKHQTGGRLWANLLGKDIL